MEQSGLVGIINFAIESIDRQIHSGYAQNHPEVLAACILGVMHDEASHRIADAIRDSCMVIAGSIK